MIKRPLQDVSYRPIKISDFSQEKKVNDRSTKAKDISTFRHF